GVGLVRHERHISDATEAVMNAGRLIKEGGAQSVKIEGGRAHAATVERMVRSGIPVMGHVGLTPQSVHAMGGFKVQGRNAENAQRILDDARALEAAGCYALVLEGVPVELARVVTDSLTIPTIGIGAGVECDGQVLVIYDLLGMFDDFVPKFVKQYAQMGTGVAEAVAAFREEVREGEFPAEAHTFHAKEPLFRPREIRVAEPEAVEEAEAMGGLYGVSV
ncbi:MAG: 3-methyl-2-oxobutanoate hydroxymethyltransferase, partial [Myxococcota bacterium]